MMMHEFVMLPKDSISPNISYSTINQTSFTTIPDELVLTNINTFFVGYSTYWDTFDCANEGLNYHGITIIPPSELPHFLRRLNQLQAECGINDLIVLCNSAISSNKYIVHFGI